MLTNDFISGNLYKLVLTSKEIPFSFPSIYFVEEVIFLGYMKEKEPYNVWQSQRLYPNKLFLFIKNIYLEDSDGWSGDMILVKNKIGILWHYKRESMWKFDGLNEIK